LLDLPTLERSLGAENETSHIGADGLSVGGNFLWYLKDGLPADLTYPVALAALVGLTLALLTRPRSALLLLGYVVLHVALISTSALHWHRWTIQVLPIAALFSGYALQWSLQRVNHVWVHVGVTAAVAVQVVAQVLVYDLQQAQPPARV